jgi:hypothetical protein
MPSRPDENSGDFGGVELSRSIENSTVNEAEDVIVQVVLPRPTRHKLKHLRELKRILL